MHFRSSNFLMHFIAEKKTCSSFPNSLFHLAQYNKGWWLAIFLKIHIFHKKKISISWIKNFHSCCKDIFADFCFQFVNLHFFASKPKLSCALKYMKTWRTSPINVNVLDTDQKSFKAPSCYTLMDPQKLWTSISKNNIPIQTNQTI